MYRSVLLVTVLFGLASAVVFDPYSRRYGICKNTISSLLTVPSGSSHCNLITGLLAFNSTLSTSANATQTNIAYFNTWVTTLETTIINNASITNQTIKLSMIAAAMSNYSMDTSNNGSVIFGAIKGMNISSSSLNWGPVSTFISITSETNIQASLQIVVPSDVHGNCKLFDSMLASCKDATVKAALTTFINTNLKEIVANSSMSQIDVVQAIDTAFTTQFFVQYPTMKQYVLSLTVQGGFAFSQFSMSAKAYKKQSLSVTLFAGSATTCPFINALITAKSSSMFTGVQKNYIGQLVTFFQAQWANTTTISARMNLMSMKFSETCDLYSTYISWMSNIQITDEFSWMDIIYSTCQTSSLPTSCGCTVPVFHTMTTMMPKMEHTTKMPMEPTTMCSCSCEMANGKMMKW